MADLTEAAEPITLFALLDRVGELVEGARTLEHEDDGRLRTMLVRYDEATRLAMKVNALKVLVDAEKKAAMALVLQRLEEEELDGAPATINGTKVRFTKTQFRVATVSDPQAFAEWASNQDVESFFEPEARLRKDLLNQLVRQRDDDGEELPPGLDIYREDRLSRTTGGSARLEAEYLPADEEED